jgi:hypothetical protein
VKLRRRWEEFAVSLFLFAPGNVSMGADSALDVCVFVCVVYDDDDMYRCVDRTVR